MKALILIGLTVLSSTLRADPQFEDRETMTVTTRKLPRLKQSQQNGGVKSEYLGADALTRFGAQSLADAMPLASGVNTQTFCANCGAKRLTIDGLRGEHTTILIDGFPLHSTISAFYGIDAIPLAGLAGVEVRRGAGAALTAPESIGGSINLITVVPRENRLKLFSEWGSHGSRYSSVLATAANDRTGIALSAQKGSQEPWDVDHNQVAESPFRTGEGFNLKLTRHLSSRTKLDYRFSEANLGIVGGNDRAYQPNTYTKIQAQPNDFLNKDVSQLYIGDLDRISDTVELTRKENALSLEHQLASEDTLRLKFSRVNQFQNANYSHAYDYSNRDQIDYYHLDYRLALERHILTLALDQRVQSMRSQSQALYVERLEPLTPDNLSFTSRGLTLLDEWAMNESFEFALALRIDHLRLKWKDLQRKVEETLWAPRFNMKWLHTDHISSNLSYGLGYRPPLTLFESEHGSDHDGFELEIDQIEKAHSSVYSLSANYPSWFVTGTAHHTRLQNMAYAFDRVVKGQPLIFKNTSETFEILALDLFAGGKIKEMIDIQASYERFIFPDSYARKLPSANLEQRATLDLDADFDTFSFGGQVAWIGSRDLSRYGYGEHYKVYDLDVDSPNFGQVSQMKNQKAPSFYMVNLRSRIKMGEVYSLTLRVNNLLNFTQTGYGDSPTTWHYHVNHAHFDNFHTWGPLTGREYFGGLEASF